VDDVGRAPAGGGQSVPSTAPVVIEVRDLEKTFRVPDQRIDSLKERATHPFTRVHYRELQAVKRISFDVRKGEFFAIVGRNGSGKSTLLKILASIYRPDAGRVRMAGRVAPFIELGVGFNPELTARENCVLNGVLMGLTRREANRRLGAVLEFAELEEFVDLQLKNYSSGMMVRLAFAVMVQADPDVMLIDEVLAVGDAAFGQKCMDVFHERRRAGRTMVLVTHDMSTVQSLCDRAMLIHDGELRYIGDPEEAALSYLRLNFGGSSMKKDDVLTPIVPDMNARIVEARLIDADGRPVDNVEQLTPLRLDVTLEARRDLAEPLFGFQVRAESGETIFGFTRTLDGHGQDHVARGDRVRLIGEIENRLVPGRYSLGCWIRRTREHGDLGLQALPLFDFHVYGTHPGMGSVSVEADITASVERRDG
ncbi:MAG TPA: ABC transporter ATP-binding protein, partial [Thermoleophilaceae bacterium]